MTKKNLSISIGTGFIGSIAANETYQYRDKIIQQINEIPNHIDSVKGEIVTKIPDIINHTSEHVSRLSCSQPIILCCLLSSESVDRKNKKTKISDIKLRYNKRQ